MSIGSGSYSRNLQRLAADLYTTAYTNYTVYHRESALSLIAGALIIFTTPLIQVIWQRLWHVFSTKHSPPHQEVLNPQLCLCVLCIFMRYNRSSGIGLSETPQTCSAAVLIQYLAGGMRPQPALLVLSLLLSILIYSSCEYCSVFHWLVLRVSDGSQLFAVTVTCSSAWLGINEPVRERERDRWAQVRDATQQRKWHSLFVVVCYFLAAVFRLQHLHSCVRVIVYMHSFQGTK